jgi:putative spermidine/putrescine transport system ATP-binding protein
MPCTVIAPAAGTIKCGSRTLRTTSPVEAKAGDQVTMMIRPEELDLGAEEENQVSGKVESVNFLGAIVRVRVDGDNGPINADLFNERLLELPNVGDEVTMSFPAHACWVMPAPK